jgi:hypothetical protein
MLVRISTVVTAIVAILIAISLLQQQYSNTNQQYQRLEKNVFISASLSAEDGNIHVYRNIKTHWPAQVKWTPEWLQNKIPTLKDVVVLDTNKFFYMDPTRPIQLKEESNQNKNKPKYMKTKDFFQKCRSQNTSYMWHSSSLSSRDENNSVFVEMDVRPIHQFVVNNSLLSVNSWMGSKNITTSLHRDFSHNMFVQLKGRKEFLLLNASIYLPMHPYTSANYLHPLSSSNWLENKNPHINNVQRIVLEPGDALYLPPLTYHQVRSLDTISISINTWSKSMEDRAMDYITYKIPLPFEKEWVSSIHRLSGCLMYLKCVLNEYGGLEMWMKNRWSTLVSTSVGRKMSIEYDTFKKGQQVSYQELFSKQRKEKFVKRALTVTKYIQESIMNRKSIQSHLLWNFADEAITFSCRDCTKDIDADSPVSIIIGSAIAEFVSQDEREGKIELNTKR